MMMLACALAFAGLSVEAPPAVGAATAVVLVDEEGRPRPGETIHVVHRPGLSGEQQVAVGITDARGRARWEPAFPGVATLATKGASLAVTIAAADAPSGRLEAWGAWWSLVVASALGVGLGLRWRRA